MTFALRSRRAISLAALVAGGVLLAGCSAPGDSSPTTVRIVSGQSAQNGDLLQSVFDRFNESRGSEVVELQMNADTDVDTAQKVLIDLAAGAGPDAVRVTNATYRTLVDAGAAQPADSCLASSEHAAGLDEDLRAGLEVDGTVYQVPWYVAPGALFYNADLFRAAGLDPDVPPATLEEFHEAALALTASGVGGGTAYFGNDFNFQGYVASLGGAVYDANVDELGIDSEAGAQTFEFFAAMSADGSAPVYTNFFVDANEAFAGGRLGMIVSASSAFPQYTAGSDFDLRLAPAPYFAAGTQISPVSTNGFVITTTDPARQALVCEALQTLLAPDTVTDTVRATATIPLLPAVADDPDGLAPFYAENPDWTAVKDQRVMVWQALPHGAAAEYTKAYGDTQLRVLRGDLAGDVAAAELQSTAEALLGGRG